VRIVAQACAYPCYYSDTADTEELRLDRRRASTPQNLRCDLDSTTAFGIDVSSAERHLWGALPSGSFWAVSRLTAFRKGYKQSRRARSSTLVAGILSAAMKMIAIT